MQILLYIMLISGGMSVMTLPFIHDSKNFLKFSVFTGIVAYICLGIIIFS